MINTDMRLYNFHLYDELNKYGQPQLSTEPRGSIKMSINSISNSTTEDVRYKDATYLGLTHDWIDESFVILYGAERLKVLYVMPKGRLKQVWLKNI
jgi:hypothetical protein